MYKERKLTRKELETLKALEKDARDKQIEYNTARDKLIREESKANNEAVRRATNIVRDVNEVYQKEKRAVDKWKAAELKRVEREYQKRLADIRSQKSLACEWAEGEVDTVKRTQHDRTDAEHARLDAALNAFLAENRLKQENIKYGPPDERKKLKPEKKEKPEKRDEPKEEPEAQQPTPA